MVGIITNISDRKDTKFLSHDNALSVEIKFHWQMIAFFLLYRWHSYINVLFFTLGAISPEKMTSRIKCRMREKISILVGELCTLFTLVSK